MRTRHLDSEVFFRFVRLGYQVLKFVKDAGGPALSECAWMESSLCWKYSQDNISTPALLFSMLDSKFAFVKQFSLGCCLFGLSRTNPYTAIYLQALLPMTENRVYTQVPSAQTETTRSIGSPPEALTWNRGVEEVIQLLLQCSQPVKTIENPVWALHTLIAWWLLDSWLHV